MNIDILIKGLEQLKDLIGDVDICQIEDLEDDTGVLIYPAYMHGAYILRKGENGIVTVEKG